MVRVICKVRVKVLFTTHGNGLMLLCKGAITSEIVIQNHCSLIWRHHCNLKNQLMKRGAIIYISDIIKIKLVTQITHRIILRRLEMLGPGMGYPWIFCGFLFPMALAALADKSQLKWRRMVLTVKQKLDICNKLNKWNRASVLMQEYSVESSTIYDICKQKGKILKCVTQSDVTQITSKDQCTTVMT